MLYPVELRALLKFSFGFKRTAQYHTVKVLDSDLRLKELTTCLILRNFWAWTNLSNTY